MPKVSLLTREFIEQEGKPRTFKDVMKDYEFGIGYGVKLNVPGTRFHAYFKVETINEEEQTLTAVNDSCTLLAPFSAIKEVCSPEEYTWQEMEGRAILKKEGIIQ